MNIFFSLLLALFISFIPPDTVGAEKGKTYFTILIVCWSVMMTVPFIIYENYGKHHYKSGKKEQQ